MRAAVGQTRHTGGMQEHLADRVVVAVDVVEEREHEQVLRVVLEHHVVELLERVDPGGGRDRRDRAIGGGLVVGRVAERVDPVERRLHQRAQPFEQCGRVGRKVALGEDRRAHVGLGELGRELFARERVSECAVRGPAREGVTAREPEQHPEGPRRDLRVHRRTRIGGADRLVHQLTPEVGRGLHLLERERHRHADRVGEPAHPVDLDLRGHDVLARRAHRRELEDRPAAGSHAAPEREELVLGGERARHRTPVHRPVAQRARRREAERAGLHRLTHDDGHRRDVVGSGRFVRRAALAHRIGAHRAVRHLHADVDRERAAVERVEVLGERLPAPVHPLAQRRTGDVLDAFHQPDEPLLGTGAYGREADAAVARDDRGDAVTRRRLEDRVPRGLTVVVRVHVDEPGRDEHPGRVDGLRGFAVERAARDRDDHAVLHRDITVESVGAGAVDDRAAGDLQVVHAGSQSG